MKFWDSSALVPLVADEPSTTAMRQLISRDDRAIVWLFTSVEILSAFGRLGRESKGLEDLLPALRSDVAALVRQCAVVTDVDGVKRRAERLVGIHPLASADAMQLGAALVACEDHPERLEFVTLDTQLARAARLEGFRVVTGG